MPHSFDSSARQGLLTRYLRLLLFCFVAALLRVVVLAPLGFLFLFPFGSPFQYLALLCPILLIFFLLPLRFSFAEGIVTSRLKKYFSFDISLSMRPYGEKLGESLLHALSVLKWGIALMLMLAFPLFGAEYFYNGTNAMAIFQSLTSLGTTATGIYASISAFFGNSQALELSGGLLEGLYVVLGILGLGVLLFLYGIMRNSAFRYIWAQATLENHSPRTEARRRLKGRRWIQLLMAVINLLLLMPFLVVILRSLSDVVGDLSTLGMLALAGNMTHVFDVGAAAAPVLFAFFCLYLPLLPLRRMLTVHFATASIRPVPAKVPAKTPVTRPMQAPASPPPSFAEISQSSPVSMPAPSYCPTEDRSYVSEASQPEPSHLEADADRTEDKLFFPSDEELPAEPLNDRDPPSFTLGQ